MGSATWRYRKFLLLGATLFTFFDGALGLKILAYNIIYAHSHANFIGKIADVLVDAGHDVVVLSPIIHTGIANTTSKKARTILVPPSDYNIPYGEKQSLSFSKNLWKADNMHVFSMFEALRETGEHMASQCETTITTPGLLAQLREEQFDVAFSEALDYCGFGIFHLLGIKKYAVTQSLIGMDHAIRLTGAPSIPSYIPAVISTSSDEMTFTQRAVNMLNTYGYKPLIEKLTQDTHEMFLRRYPDNPSFDTLVSQSTYFFYNADPVIDFPRLMTRKFVEIGGISVPQTVKPLPKWLLAVLELRPRTVLISFGTVVLSHDMPEQFKKTIRQTALAFPDVTFLWKYEKDGENVTQGVENLITRPWLPQHDLLAETRLAAFVTHGGLGSTYETVLAGVPVVAIPVMGDQMRNGAMIKRAGIGLLLHKDDLVDARKLISAVRQVLNDPRYKNRAREVSRKIADSPQPVREKLVSHFEFMAKYGPLPELNHLGSSLNFIVYHNIDVWAVILLVSLTLLALAFAISKTVVKFMLNFFSPTKSKVA